MICLRRSVYHVLEKTFQQAATVRILRRGVQNLCGGADINREKYICENTEIVSDHMTPEIKLRLITPKCSLYFSKEPDVPFVNPYWGFYWPGGQVLARYILDNRWWFQGRHVVDVGSGCGAVAIACAKAMASSVTANDICETAAAAIKMNATLNDVSCDILIDDLVNRAQLEPWDTFLLGDMLYDYEMTDKLLTWLRMLVADGRTVYLADPGRPYLSQHPLKKHLFEIASYDLDVKCKEENYGLVCGKIWALENGV